MQLLVAFAQIAHRDLFEKTEAAQEGHIQMSVHVQFTALQTAHGEHATVHRTEVLQCDAKI